MAKKNYFDNDAVEAAIKEYQKTIEEGDPRIQIMHPYVDQFDKLVRAVINTHKIYRFHNDIEELIQEGLTELFASFGRFNPEKGTAFNYLSITVKNHLKNWTQTRNKKDWKTTEFNDTIYESSEADLYYDNFEIREMLFSVPVKPELEPILAEIVDLVIEEKVLNKRDVVRFLSRKGHSKVDISKVYKEMEAFFTDDR